MKYYVSNDRNNPIIIPEGQKDIGSGNEGIVYNCGGLAVKIINGKSWMDENKVDVLSSAIQPNLIHLPMAPLYDKDGVFSGYVMKLIETIEMPFSQMRCENIIKSIDIITKDAEMLAEQQIAIKDTTLRNIVISSKNGLINVIDPDRYLTIYSPQCNLSTTQEFKSANFYWVNRMCHSIYNAMIDQVANGRLDRNFRFYLRHQVDDALERRIAPQYMTNELTGFATVSDYLNHKREFVKKINTKI